MGVPKSAPAAIIDRLNKEINAALVDHNIKARLTELGSEPLAGSAAEFGKMIAEETVKWAKVIKFANLKLG